MLLYHWYILSGVFNLCAVGLNQFSDMTFTEFKKHFLWAEPQVTPPLEDTKSNKNNLVLFIYLILPLLVLLQNCSATKGSYTIKNSPHPDSIDWRKKGNYVTPVKNQVRLEHVTIFPFCHFLVQQ